MTIYDNENLTIEEIKKRSNEFIRKKILKMKNIRYILKKVLFLFLKRNFLI